MSERIDDFIKQEYKLCFETDQAPLGLNEEIVHFISKKKNEPAWMLEWRLKAYKKWLQMHEPKWGPDKMSDEARLALDMF